MWSNERIVAAFKRKARIVAFNHLEVSAADLYRNMRNQITGPARGSLIKKAFEELISEGTLSDSGLTKVNRQTKSRVRVYRLA